MFTLSRTISWFCDNVTKKLLQEQRSWNEEEAMNGTHFLFILTNWITWKWNILLLFSLFKIFYEQTCTRRTKKYTLTIQHQKPRNRLAGRVVRLEEAQPESMGQLLLLWGLHAEMERVVPLLEKPWYASRVYVQPLPLQPHEHCLHEKNAWNAKISLLHF